MNAVTNYLEKLGSNFFVSALVPSLALVLASILVFDPILNVAHRFWNPENTYQLISFGVLITVISVIIGFTLTALNTYILKMFEGYIIFPPIRFLYNKTLKMHQEKAYRLLLHRDKLKDRVRHWEKLAAYNPGGVDRLEALKEKYYQAVTDYDQRYPEARGDILPSRFGNTLKAAENYSGDRYGLDGVQFWPRLGQVIPTEYKLTIDTVRNELSFLVNMSILSVTFSVLCVIAIFYSMLTVTAAGTHPVVYLGFLGTLLKYLFAAALGFISCRFFYNASIFSVGSFGLMIRSSFDLFRLDLLKQLGAERPKDSIDEFDAWSELNELIVLGRHSLTFKKINYRRDETDFWP